MVSDISLFSTDALFAPFTLVSLITNAFIESIRCVGTSRRKLSQTDPMNSHEFHFYSHEILTSSENRCLLRLLAKFYVNAFKIRKPRTIYGIFSVNPHSVFQKYFFLQNNDETLYPSASVRFV